MTTETINAEIKAEDIAALLNKHGARSFLVGGCVRDKLLGIEPKDYDMEVYGLTPEKLKSIVGDHYILDEIGASFQVLKIKGWDIEISTPRREVQIGDKHTSFKTEYDPNMSYVDACSRRDVTCNAIMQCLTTGEYIDPLGGIKDLRDKIIKPTSPRFKEDPLRVLRAMQFIGRFEMQWTIELQEMCSELNPSQLSRERIWEEWLKYLLKSTPDGIIMGWQFLRDCEWTKYFPEIHNLIGCPQGELNHPEGCVWTHTSFCLQEYARHRTGNEYEDTVVGLAVLCHDFGKPQWTRYEEGKFKAHGHEEGGEDPTRRFLGGITNQRNIIEDVVALVLDHLKPVQLHKANSKMGAVRRLALRVPIERLLRVCTADIHGRPPLVPDTAACDWLRIAAKEYEVESKPVERMITGNHLLDLGYIQGPLIGCLLNYLYELQMDGDITSTEEGLRNLENGNYRDDFQNDTKKHWKSSPKINDIEGTIL